MWLQVIQGLERLDGGMDFELWFQMVWEVLQADEEACLALIRAAGGQVQQAAISLVEGDLTVLDALVYARTLVDLGRLHEAHEVLNLVVSTAFGM